MKHLLTFLTIFLFAATLHAQDCAKYYIFKKGLETELTVYDKKGRVSAVTTTKVFDIKKEGKAQVATMLSIVKDDKGKTLSETNFNATCKGNLVSIDFKSLISPQIYKQYENMEMEFEGTNLDIPNELPVDAKLADANILITVNMNGIKMKMNLDIVDRKVVGHEKITTPAGTFDCVVITQSTKIVVGLKTTLNSKQWLAEGVGLVKQEDYNRNGAITSSSMLTSFKK